MVIAEPIATPPWPSVPPPARRRKRRRSKTKARRWSAALALAGILVLLGIGRWASTDAARGLPVIALTSESPRFSVAWLGDTLIGDEATPGMDKFGTLWPTARLPKVDADVVVVNLEGPITERTTVWDPSQPFSYESRPSAAQTLAQLGVDVASLANNHAMDRGPVGLADTIGYLERAGIEPFGAGSNSTEASAPLLVRTKIGTLAIIGFVDSTNTRKTAGKERAGSRHLNVENVSNAINQARRAGADWTVAFVHWGGNYEAVDPDQRAYAQMLADAGYDLVIGHGPHIVQPIEKIGNTTVAFSIGNYIFGTFGRFADRGVQGRGLVLTTEFGPNRTVRLSARCVLTDNQVVHYQPRPCSKKQARATISGLNPSISYKKGLGTLDVSLPANAR